MDKLDDQSIQKIFEGQKQKSLLLRGEHFKQRKLRLKNLMDWILSHRTAIQEALFDDFRKPAAEVEFTETFIVINEIKHALKNLSR